MSNRGSVSKTTVVQEHQLISPRDTLEAHELRILCRDYPNVFKRREKGVAASNFVGVVSTKSGALIEILPKIELTSGDDDDHSRTRELFLRMLRSSNSVPLDLPESSIRSLKHYPMLSVFIRQFLRQLNELARLGLARSYVTEEGNLPYVKGRILFNQHVKENAVNKARYYVSYSELSVNRAVNRLIVSTLQRLDSRIGFGENRDLLDTLKILFADVPNSTNIVADWQAHHVDRSMRHYSGVMRWIGLFLFQHGLATLAGKHANLSLLFPMEKIFEDYVTACIRRLQSEFQVKSQYSKNYLATLKEKKVFNMRPDIALLQRGKVPFILDAKWKSVDTTKSDMKHDISQGDLYQLFAYGKSFGCKAVALIYPKSRVFRREFSYRFFDGLPVLCFPFDIERPKDSVTKLVSALHSS